MDLRVDTEYKVVFSAKLTDQTIHSKEYTFPYNQFFD